MANQHPRPWTYGHVSGDDRKDGSGWGTVGFWDANGMKVLGSDDGWDAEFEEPEPEVAAFILALVNGTEVPDGVG